MSKIPGPTGRNPCFEASRTPGALGMNDSASPDRPKWLLGDTPGALGINDYAAAISGRRAVTLPTGKSDQWEKFLDSLCNWNLVSGPPIAWVSQAHHVITIDAASDPVLRAMLPPQDVRRRVLKVLSKLPNDVVATDVTLEQFSDSKRGHKYLSQYGQATHFMANKGQSQRTAYAAGVEKVFGPAERAVKLFKKIADDSDLATRTASPLDDVSVALADGVHALQDSFSPTHVQRDKLGDKFVIMRLQVWSEQDKKDHKAGDESWKGKDGKLTPLGQACREATLTLLSYFIFRVINKDADAERQRRLLMDKYFCPAGPGRSGW